MGKKVWLLALIMFFITINYAFAQSDISPSTKAYLDSQTQKEIAQISAKIDQTATRLEKDLEKEVEEIQAQVKTELQDLIAGTVKAMAIGLGGIVIISLAVFKVIDLKLTSTKNMKKYEKQLKKQSNELRTLITDTNTYQKTLVAWHKQLHKADQDFRLKGVITTLPQPQISIKQEKAPLIVPVKTKKKMKWWKKLLIILGAIIILGVIAFIIIKLVT